MCVCLTYSVHVTSDDVHVRTDGPQIVLNLGAAQVARRQNILNFSRKQEGAETLRQGWRPMRDVEVANSEHQLPAVGSVGSRRRDKHADKIGR